MPAVDLANLLCEARADTTVDLGELLRAEMAAEDPHARPFAIRPMRLFVIALSFALTLMVGISVFVAS